LGFGTSGIMGAALTTSRRLRLLEAAYAHGIRHFDTAPLYGQGEAESLLGQFSRGKRDSITITTKFGLTPRRIPAWFRPLVPIARAFNRRLLIPYRQRRSAQQSLFNQELKGDSNQLKDELHPASITAIETPLAPPVVDSPSPPVEYSAAVLRDQIETSLRKLSTDYIDYYLLHECQAAYLNQPFLESLEKLVQEGKIRHYGIGSGRWQSRCILNRYPMLPWIVQIPDGLTDHDTSWFSERSSKHLFTHSTLRLSLEKGRGSEQHILALWAEITNQNSERPGLLGEVLLHAALTKNSLGCVIFSSGNPERIRSNAEILRAATAYRPAAEQLLDALIATPASTPI
jgi:aryl-alcohol dehydrogenase-like predicted oxidoreductase